MSAKNYLGYSESTRHTLLTLAQDVLAGKIRMAPENRAFYEQWARNYIEFRKEEYGKLTKECERGTDFEVS